MIIWIASYPRSGNTLLRTILRRCFGLQTHSLYDDSEIASLTEFSEIVGHVSHHLDPQSFYEKAAGSDHLYFVKTHDPPQDEAKAIYVVRDGRSSVVSHFHYLKDFVLEAECSLEDVIIGDCQFGSWSDHFEAWAPRERPNTLLLRYDDMLRDFNQVAKTLSAFIELPVLSSSSEPRSFPELQAVDSKFFRSGSDANNI